MGIQKTTTHGRNRHLVDIGNADNGRLPAALGVVPGVARAQSLRQPSGQPTRTTSLGCSVTAWPDPMVSRMNADAAPP